ncbi:MAG: NgoBV family restriction endonuclease [Akkermansia sp.]|nr:NgoBV family restriction endonuclease [Akkermansia sp.]
MNKTARQVYDMLINEYHIKSLHGLIRFHLGDVVISVKKKDVVGNIIQEWVESWLQAKGISYMANPCTQMPPDVFLNPRDKTSDLLEIKAFNRKSSPAFDIADFKSFVREIIQHPYYLDTDFLIFGYTMDSQNGDVVIKDLWLKKIWEITRPMDNWPITCQYKNGVLQKMRPGTWYGNSRQFKFFENKEDYLSALEETIYKCRETRDMAEGWRNAFCKSYKNHYNADIDFPYWARIKGRYIF